MEETLHWVCWALGLCLLLSLVWRLGCVLWLYCAPVRPLSEVYGKGTWAVVTGASSGIGEALASGLAQDGFNLLLVARTQSKLQSLAKVLQERCHIQAEALPVDLSRDNAWQAVVQAMRDRHWTVLVNNAGVLYFRELVHVSPQLAESSITLHIRTLVYLTQKFLTTGSGRKAIINLGSMTGSVPMPSIILYSSSKAFIHAFSSALACETQADVLCVAPTCVQSEMTWNLGIDSAESAAAAILRCVGRTRWMAGSVRQEALHWMTSALPLRVVQAVFKSVGKIVQLANRR